MEKSRRGGVDGEEPPGDADEEEADGAARMRENRRADADGE